jgi:hypothetical protein
MKLFVHEVFEKVSAVKKKQDKIDLLKKHETWALKDIVRGSMDTTIQWNLPPGSPPYIKNIAPEGASNLLSQHRQFKYFVKGGVGDELPPYKRENIFIRLLEAIHPEDAKLVIDMINKVKPKGLTRPVIKEAFPNLLQD